VCWYTSDSNEAESIQQAAGAAAPETQQLIGSQQEPPYEADSA